MSKKRFKRLVVKVILLLADHALLLIGVYVGSILLGGALYAWVEPEKSLLQGTYWADTTAMTVGYGDESPSTPLGIIIYFVISKQWVWLLTPIIIAKVVTVVLVDKGAFTHAEQEHIMARLEEIAVAVGLPPKEQPHDYLESDEDTSEDVPINERR